MFASSPSIKDFALKLPNVAVATATADACATELAVIESWSEVFGMRRAGQPAVPLQLTSISRSSPLHDHVRYLPPPLSYVLYRRWIRLRPVYSDTTQLTSTSSWVELRCYKRAFICIKYKLEEHCSDSCGVGTTQLRFRRKSHSQLMRDNILCIAQADTEH